MLIVLFIAILIAAIPAVLLDLSGNVVTTGSRFAVCANVAFLGGVLLKNPLTEAISRFGAQATAKLKNVAITGAPEDQLGKPIEDLIEDLAVASGMVPKSVGLVGETTMSGMQIRPDFAVTVNSQLVGFIELKRPGKGADPRKFSVEHDKAQWKKLQSLPNLLYTDGNSFSLWRSGEQHGKIVTLEGDVESSGAKLAAPDTLLPLISDFLRWAPEAPKTAEQLARICAKLCRLLRDEVTEQLAEGNKSLTHLAADWRKLLFPDATDERFADGYAQAVTFGLLMARAYNIPLDKGIEVVALELRKTNSLIGTALRLLTDDPANQEALKTSLGTLMRVLNVVDWTKISKGKPEAWLTFYEDFLQVYDNSLRKQTGSYYTPPEVVDTMVRLVDEALKGPLFKRSLGIASSDVTIADPAVGTGTFLLGVLRKIADNVRVDQGEGSVPNAVKAAAERLFGFELQFGPFAVAQLRLLAEMRALIHPDENKEKDKEEGKAPPAIPDLHLFVTDTLSNPFVEEESFSSMEAAIAQSKRDANKVKRGQPIMVVIGNPPYKNKAADMGSWIEQGSAGRSAAMDWWTPPVNWGVGAHSHHLKNLYVYFWRWAALKVFGSGWNAATGEADTDRHGLVCFITVAGFLNGPGFAKMRAELRRDCSEIWVIDCSPDGHQPDVPTRIFQGVQQPVCIVLAARKAGKDKDKDKPAKLKFCALPEGKRDSKFAALKTLSLKSRDWQEGPSGWREPFLPERAGMWSGFTSLVQLFDNAMLGAMPGRTWVISPDKQTLDERWKLLIAEKDSAKKSILFHPHPNGDKTLDKPSKSGLPNHSARLLAVSKDFEKVIAPTRYAMRSFDREWLIPDVRLINRPSPDLWHNYSDQQVHLTAPDRTSPSNGPAISFTDLIVDLDHYHGRGGRVLPLWRDAAATISNFYHGLLARLTEELGVLVTPPELYAYIAAVLAHPAFTARFQKDLKRPGLRVPLTADAQLFTQAVELGREVVWLHCYGERFHDDAAGRPQSPPRLPKERAPSIPKAGAIPPAPPAARGRR